jgi:hypothetical protein
MALPGADSATPLRVRALDAVGGLAYWSGDGLEANRVYEEELVVARSIGDRPGQALALLDLFFTRENVGDIDGAMAAKAESEAIYGELGDAFGLARIAQSGFLILMARGAADPDAVRDELERRATAAEASGDPWQSRVTASFRGFAALLDGDLRGAFRSLARGLRESLIVRERSDAALGMMFAVVLAPLAGRPELGATIHGAIEGTLERMGIRSPASYADFGGGEDPMPAIEAALGPEAFAEAVARGRRLSLEAAIDLIAETAETLA